MKKYLVGLILLYSSVSGFSQEVINNTYDRQIGVDVTTLLSQFLNFSSTGSFSNNDFFFSYKKTKEKGRLRIGVGANFLVEEKTNGTNSNFNVAFRAGKERYTRFAKRWTIFYGGDFKLKSNFVSFGSTDASQLKLSIGGGPICGIQFQINSRLSLSTEAAYDAFFLIENVGGKNLFGAGSAFSVPDFIYLNFDF